MDTETKRGISLSKVPVSNVVMRWVHFLIHFLEMCLSMCIGGIALNFVFFWGSSTNWLCKLLPALSGVSTLVIAILLSVPMVGWMRFREHEWRPTLEMASTTPIVGILLVISAWTGLISTSSMLPLQKALACPVMFIPMLLRLNLYSGSHASHKHPMQHEHHAS